jgi:hypothetical protein
LHDLLHDFGAKVLRPIGQELDRMRAAQVIAAGSPYWHALSRGSPAASMLTLWMAINLGNTC